MLDNKDKIIDGMKLEEVYIGLQIENILERESNVDKDGSII